MGLLQSYLHLSSHTEAQRYLEFVDPVGKTNSFPGRKFDGWQHALLPRSCNQDTLVRFHWIGSLGIFRTDCQPVTVKLRIISADARGVYWRSG